MKRVIVATDFSIDAENAMHYAAAAAAQAAYEIVLFHLSRISIHALNARASNNAIELMLKKQEDQLNTVAAQVSEQYGITTAVYVGMGDFIEEIKNCIQTYGAELVVLGMPDKSVEQRLLGDTTTKALYTLKVPTLAIPIDVKYKPIQHLLFACDVMRGVHQKVLQGVSEIARDFHADVEVFYVRKDHDDDTENAAGVLEELKLHSPDAAFLYKTTRSGAVLQSIKAEIAQYKADILIMVPYKYGFWGSIIHRSMTKAMASGNKIPLLSIPL